MSETAGILSMVAEIDALKQRVAEMKTHQAQFEIAANKAIVRLHIENAKLEAENERLEAELKVQNDVIERQQADRVISAFDALSKELLPLPEVKDEQQEAPRIKQDWQVEWEKQKRK